MTAPEAPRQGSTPAPPAIKATWRALPTVTVEGQPAQFRSVMLYAFEDQIELQLHTGEHSCSKVAMLTTEGDDVSVSLTIRDKDDGEGATQRTVTHLMSGVSAPLTEWTFDGESAAGVFPRMELNSWGKAVVLEGPLDADACPAPERD